MKQFASKFQRQNVAFISNIQYAFIHCMQVWSSLSKVIIAGVSQHLAEKSSSISVTLATKNESKWHINMKTFLHLPFLYLKFW